MATSIIPGNLIVGSIVSKNSTDISYANVRQTGRTITLSGYLHANCSANTEKLIASISGVDLPKSAIRTMCGVAAYPYGHPADVAYLVISTAGEISINTTIEGWRHIYFNVTWIA